MPRSFDLSADYEGSVEDVHRAFHDEEYWQGRLAETPVDVATLEAVRLGGESGTDGTIAVVTTQTVLSQNLPALVTQLHRGDLCVRREETWSPINEGVATALFSATIVGAPVNVSGTALLATKDESGLARMTVEFTIQVRVPFIGGKIEKMIGSELAELVALEQRFTTKWIANHA